MKETATPPVPAAMCKPLHLDWDGVLDWLCARHVSVVLNCYGVSNMKQSGDTVTDTTDSGFCINYTFVF